MFVHLDKKINVMKSSMSREGVEARACDWGGMPRLLSLGRSTLKISIEEIAVEVEDNQSP